MDHPIALDSRKQQILKAVVADYTRTGVPVGSQALALHLASWSSATIRNELAMLSEVGYLIQPHTSAGRVPSDLGYRYYVDFLMEEEELPPVVRRQMEPLFAPLGASLEEILEVAATALALATDGVSLVTGPGSAGARLKHLDLVSLDPDHALLVLVLEGNVVRQHTVKLSSPSDQAALSALAAALNTDVAGLDAVAIESSESDDAARREVLAAVVTLMRSVDAQQDTLVVHDGVRNLLRQPEFGDVELLRQVIAVVEEERTLAALIAQLDLGRGVQIMIGRENSIEELSRCSLVLTTYRAGADRRGTIGVLGPTRMLYGQVAPRVRYVAQRLGRALERVLS
ncbi:MAG: heat-inducible transcription repressor HrcA [Candidatus Dormibacteraeota bacterium]|nr:heat-inducible transcription repressor HrcA [Candidatus Dormibacteraeota bacterium]MBV8444393.1 heat-inducible transcription repressor HrcA [Candidatus Dormibacteraeota bacterium]